MQIWATWLIWRALFAKGLADDPVTDVKHSWYLICVSVSAHTDTHIKIRTFIAPLNPEPVTLFASCLYAPLYVKTALTAIAPAEAYHNISLLLKFGPHGEQAGRKWSLWKKKINKKLSGSLEVFISAFISLVLQMQPPSTPSAWKTSWPGQKRDGIPLISVSSAAAAEGHLTQDVDARVCRIAAGRSLLVEGDSRLCAPVAASDKALRDWWAAERQREHLQAADRQWLFMMCVCECVCV